LLDANLTTELIFGKRKLKQHVAEIRELRSRCGQQDDLTTEPLYFIATTTKRRTVGAVLFYSGSKLEGCVLFREFHRFGLTLGLARLGDLVGDELAIGSPSLHLQLVDRAARALLRSRRLHALFLTVKAPMEECIRLMGDAGEHANYSRREVQHKLPLAESYEAMLASFGPRTRRSLATKRRQLEERMKVVFEPSLDPDSALVVMKALRTKALPLRTEASLHKRKNLHVELPGFFSMGMRTPDGTWLSILNGFRCNGTTYIDHQMNDQALKQESLSAVMRAFMLEHEIKIGQHTVSFVGGCSLLLGRYCEPETRTDMLLTRPGLRSKLFKKLVPPARLKRIIEWTGPTLAESYTQKEQRRFFSTSSIESLPRKNL
jgi:hypothetical protein